MELQRNSQRKHRGKVWDIQHMTILKIYNHRTWIRTQTRRVRERFAEHKQYVRSSDLKKPSGYHFNQPGHDVSHLKGLVLEQVKSSDPFVLRAREYIYIEKFDTWNNGLNKEP